MLDPSIPLQGRGFDLADIMGKAQQMRMNQMRMEDYGTERANKARLRDLLPRAVHGDRQAIDEVAGIDPDMFARLDDRERAQAKAKTADLASAVRWADTPEKWEQVIDHYGQEGVDLTQYRGRFDQRESAMLQLGKIGEYIDAAPKPEYRSVEAGGSLIDVSNGNPRVVIAPNSGDQPMGAPVRQAGNVPQGAADMLRSNPSLAQQFDEKYGPGAAQKVLGGPTPQASGGFPH